MKFIYILLFLLIVFSIALFPFVRKEKMCYDTSQKQINQINLNVPSKGWMLDQVCGGRQDTLVALEECLQQATGSSKIAVYTNDIISKAVFFIRPLTVSLSRQKIEHNDECNEFIKFQLE